MTIRYPHYSVSIVSVLDTRSRLLDSHPLQRFALNVQTSRLEGDRVSTVEVMPGLVASPSSPYIALLRACLAGRAYDRVLIAAPLGYPPVAQIQSRDQYGVIVGSFHVRHTQPVIPEHRLF